MNLLHIRPEARPAAGALAAELARCPPVPCREQPDLWFSVEPEDRELAILLCGDCPAWPECRAFARANREQHGVWGGEVRTVVKAATAHEKEKQHV